MMLVKLCMFCVFFSISAGEDHFRPGLVQEFYNVFNNLSNLASMPHLMETPDCRRDCEIYRQALFQNEMWAAEMFDANGRLAFGILKGNTHQLGHMDQCVSSSSEISNIEGKFCFIKVYLKPLPNNTFMNEVWEKAFNFTLVTSKPYERTIIPTSENLLTSVCVPSSCTTRDLMTASRKILSSFNQTSFGFEVHVDDMIERNCAVKREYYANNPFVDFAKIIIISMIILVICGSIFDMFILPDDRDNRKLLTNFSNSFSLQRNYQILMSDAKDSDSVGCLNGLRCITYFFLFLLHYSIKFVLVVVDRSDNFTKLFQNSLFVMLTKNSTLVLDLLIFTSGISHSYKITKFLMKNNTKSILKSLLYKYLRFFTFWIIFLAIQSNTVIKTKLNLLYTPAENKTPVWSIFLCLENFYGIQNMYFAPAHSFYTDIQLYFICCIVLPLARCGDKIKLLFSIAFWSLFCRSLFLYFHDDVPPFLTFGLSVDQLCSMMHYMFTTPLNRLPFYMSGVALGYYMRENPNSKFTVSSLNKKVGCVAALFSFGIAIISYYPQNPQNTYNSFNGALITFIHSFCSIIAIVWTVWYCEMVDKTSIINRILANSKFVILNRLTTYFSAIHILVLYVCLVDTRFLFEFKISEILGLDYLLLTILVCAFLMLFLHLPLKNLWENLITRKKDIYEIDTAAIRHKQE